MFDTIANQWHATAAIPTDQTEYKSTTFYSYPDMFSQLLHSSTKDPDIYKIDKTQTSRTPFIWQFPDVLTGQATDREIQQQ